MKIDDRLRAWWSYLQGLDGRLAGFPAADILNATGWARSVGSVCPYVTLHSRGGVTRAEADKAVKATAILELPSARGCMYVVGARDHALALRVGEPFSEAERRTARRLGVLDDEISRLDHAILDVLASGPMLPSELRRALGDAVRNLGDEGKKKGLTTTLPVALGHLQVRGEIRRISATGRLDRQRYRYIRWNSNPLSAYTLTLEEARVELARRYFEWTAPATVAEFRWFSGLGAKAARAALEPLGLVAVRLQNTRLILPSQLEAFRNFSLPTAPAVSLISSLDALALLRRNAASLVAAADRDHPLLVSRASGLTDLPYHAIIDRGRLIGFWEYDPQNESVVWATFSNATQEVLEAVAHTEAFIKSDLQDARAFSLDSPKRRAPRLKVLKRFQGQAAR